MNQHARSRDRKAAGRADGFRGDYTVMITDRFIRPKTLRSAFNAVAAGASVLLSACAANATLTDNTVHSPHLSDALNEQVVRVPASNGTLSAELESTIFKPPGDGPFPVVIMNHGKRLGSPRQQGRDRFVNLSREFVKRGYAVIIPMRKGFSNSTGEFADSHCDMVNDGHAQADDVQSTLEYLATQPWADKDRVLIAGQSHGALGTLAMGTRQIPGVRGLINFAGGLKYHGEGSCDWQNSLVKAFADYGGKTTLPSLWFYGKNDSHFGPKLAARFHEAYTKAGGDAKLVAFGPFKKDAHGLSASRDGVKIWWPETEKFLKKIGLPTDEVYALADEPALAKSRIPVNDVAAVPYLGETGRENYSIFLKKPYPRAFAMSPTGAWAWAEDGDDPSGQALEECNKNSSQPCSLYAEDNHVVWPAEPALAAQQPSPSNRPPTQGPN